MSLYGGGKKRHFFVVASKISAAKIVVLKNGNKEQNQNVYNKWTKLHL